jgi:Putative peptidoglycan binding domain/Peptidoglycan-synthase activator LpoB
MHCSFRFARVAIVLISLGACQALQTELNQFAELAPGAGGGGGGGDYPEAYACRRLVVATFDGQDGDWIAGQLEGGLNQIHSYSLVDRRKLSAALDELGFQRSALVDQSTAGRIGKMIGADCILTGNVNFDRVAPESYKSRACVVNNVQLPIAWGALCPGKMDDVYCTQTKADAVLVPRLIKVESGEIVYAQTATGTATDRSCRGDSLHTPVNAAGLQQEAIADAVKQIVADLTPKSAGASSASAASDNGACPRLRKPGDVRQAQEMLTGLGYAPGPVDGRDGGQTAQAMRRFAEDTAYRPVDGVLTSCAMTAITTKYVAALRAGTVAASTSTGSDQGVAPAATPASGTFEDLGLK